MTEGTLIKWLKNEGDNVAEKEPILEIETEKLSYIVEASASGVILKIMADEGEKYPVASALGYIGAPGDTIPDSQALKLSAPKASAVSLAETSAVMSATPSPGGRVFISPLAKKIAANMGIDYRQIKGTGPNGRIVKADVLRYSESGASARNTPRAERPSSLIPYTGIRRAIGETMAAAWRDIPMVTHHVNADMGEVLDLRKKLNEGVADKAERVTIGELILKLTAIALKSMPIMNSSLTDKGIVLHGSVNLGMATALKEGLIVPVIHDADIKGLREISREAKLLAAGARSGNLNPDQLHGGTFTISNLGGYGSVDHFTPIINPPQAAILGVGRVNDVAVPTGGELKIRPMVGLSLTYDHRIIDGATAAEFIKTLMDSMANPLRALL